MKAILVIDIDANELPEDAYANVYVFGKYGEQEDDFVQCIGDVPLKPMPQKLKLRIQREWITDYDRYEIGYNACLDDITGETERKQ